MTDLPANSSAIIARAKAILLKPAEEWPRIAAEATSAKEVYLGYVVPLAAIGPICRFLRGQIFGWGAFGISYHPGLLGGLAELVVGYVLEPDPKVVEQYQYVAISLSESRAARALQVFGQELGNIDRFLNPVGMRGLRPHTHAHKHNILFFRVNF